MRTAKCSMTGPEALQTEMAAGGAGNFTPWFALE
jgi:hypothetical protein